MKKLMTVLMMILMVGFLAACGEDDTTDSDEGNNEETNEESDATSGATQSVITDEASLLEAVSADGGWIVIFEEDMETSEELVLAPGENDGEAARKLALYTQDEDRNITDQFTLTAPMLTVQGENTRIQGGTFAGDVLVEANGFSIPDGTIDGNLTFASAEYEASADLSGGEVTGEVTVEGGDTADATSGATQSVITDEASLLEAVSADGGWIVIFEEDMETSEELVLAPGENDGEAARKLALYTQDEDRNITDQFTLTAPMLTVQGENTRIQGGTFAGDVLVDANGFSIPDGTIDGDLIFADAEYEASADLSGGEVTGNVSVQ